LLFFAFRFFLGGSGCGLSSFEARRRLAFLIGASES
jgi:hypothetical protein